MRFARRVLGLATCGSILVACSAVDSRGAWSSEGGGGTGALGATGSTFSATSAPPVPQRVLVLDFRSGWWSGGGGGTFYNVALPALAQASPGTTVEYHHFEVALRVRCLVAGISAPACDMIPESVPTTPAGVVALFEKPHWDDYTQVWILSGSAADVADVDLSGALFDTFLAETHGSCIPVFIGAGDGFISHGNAIAKELGIGEVLATDFVYPGFFSVPGYASVSIETRMYAGMQLSPHVLFENLSGIADTISCLGEETHGDSIVENGTTIEVIAHDSRGKPAIAVGSVSLPTGDRPFVIDAGFQRFYAVRTGEDTRTYLQNIVRYLASVGCKAQPTK